MTIDPETKYLLRRIAEALERIAPPLGVPEGAQRPEWAAPSDSRPHEVNAPPDANAHALLKRHNVREPHLSRLARQVTAEQVHAWRRYLQQSDIAPEHRTGYMIRRLYAGDAPPSEYDELVRRYVPLEHEDIIVH